MDWLSSSPSPEGPLPRKESDTRVCFGLSDSTVDTEWSASAANGPSEKTVCVSISSAPTAPVGRYTLTAEQEGQKIRLGEFILLFNAWCSRESCTHTTRLQKEREADLVLPGLPGDAVYMRSETKRHEYVLTQHGQIYRGTYKRIKGTPWNYGQVPTANAPPLARASSHINSAFMHLQFDPDVLDICLMILDSNPKFVSDADQDCSARGSPVYVTRVLSAMVGRRPGCLRSRSRLPWRTRQLCSLNSSLQENSTREYKKQETSFFFLLLSSVNLQMKRS